MKTNTCKENLIGKEIVSIFTDDSGSLVVATKEEFTVFSAEDDWIGEEYNFDSNSTMLWNPAPYVEEGIFTKEEVDAVQEKRRVKLLGERQVNEENIRAAELRELARLKEKYEK